jgi:Na+-translocating ferredoxin:NAD+ oxidoreductase subunit B
LKLSKYIDKHNTVMLWVPVYNRLEGIMTDNRYIELRETLDRFPNGYPATDDGLELRFLEKIFSPEEAGIASKLKMKFETVQQIAERTGLEADYLGRILEEMQGKGQIFRVRLGKIMLYKLLPFVFGIYEYQLYRIDREMAELAEEYFRTAFGPQFGAKQPSLLKVVPIEKTIAHTTAIQPYQSLSKLISGAKAWAVDECICKKEKGILGDGCSKPREVCIGIAPVENFFDDFFWGKSVTKDEALKVLEKAEEAGLVHMTSNVQEGHILICNCCGCCCAILRGINKLGLDNAAAKSDYVAVIDHDACTGCGICLDRCQVRAIDMNDTAEVNGRCIGCGLCVTTCPADSVSLRRRDNEDILDTPLNEKDWVRKKAASRGRDDYKELL